MVMTNAPEAGDVEGLDGAATYRSVPVPLLVHTFILTATLANVSRDWYSRFCSAWHILR